MRSMGTNQLLVSAAPWKIPVSVLTSFHQTSHLVPSTSLWKIQFPQLVFSFALLQITAHREHSLRHPCRDGHTSPAARVMALSSRAAFN